MNSSYMVICMARMNIWLKFVHNVQCRNSCLAPWTWQQITQILMLLIWTKARGWLHPDEYRGSVSMGDERGNAHLKLKYYRVLDNLEHTGELKISLLSLISEHIEQVITQTEQKFKITAKILYHIKCWSLVLVSLLSQDRFYIFDIAGMPMHTMAQAVMPIMFTCIGHRYGQGIFTHKHDRLATLLYNVWSRYTRTAHSIWSWSTYRHMFIKDIIRQIYSHVQWDMVPPYTHIIM